MKTKYRILSFALCMIVSIPQSYATSILSSSASKSYNLSDARGAWQWILDNVLQPFKKKKKIGGSRGDKSICADSPIFEANNSVLWTRQPLFVWKGSAMSIAVFAEDGSVFWVKNFQPSLKSSSIKIDNPLELDKKYIWTVIADPYSKSVNPQVSFQTVSIKKYKEISKDLKILEDRLKREQADQDEIILIKVKYFASRSMWGDVQSLLQEIPSSSQYYQKSLQTLTEIKEKLSRCTERY